MRFRKKTIAVNLCNITKTFVPVVALVCAALTVLGCNKGKKIGAAIEPTVVPSLQQIVGTRLMHGTEHNAEIGVYDSIVHLPDSAIAFTMFNDSTIGAGGEKFVYVRDLSNDSLLYFWTVSKDSLFKEFSVTYFVLRDSIVVDKLVLVTANGYDETIYNTIK